MLKMFRDKKFYSETTYDSDSNTRNHIVTIINDQLFEKEVGYLGHFKHSVNYFYGLPRYIKVLL